MNEALEKRLVDQGGKLLGLGLPQAIGRDEFMALKADRQREWNQRLAQLRRLGVPTAVAPSSGYSITVTASAQSATAKTTAGVAAGSNKPITLAGFDVSCDGTTGNLRIDLVFGTNATNPPGTNSTAFTALQVRGGTETFEGSGAINWTAEPTVLVVQKVYRLPMPSGPVIVMFPLGREPTGTPTAATSGKFMGLRLAVSTGTPNADVNLEVEE